MKKITIALTGIALLSLSQSALAGRDRPFPPQDIGKLVDCKVTECQPLEQVYIKITYKYDKFRKDSRSNLEMSFVGDQKEFGPFRLTFGEQYIYRKDAKFDLDSGFNWMPFPVVAEFENGSVTYDRNHLLSIPKFQQADKIRKDIINNFATSPIFRGTAELAHVLSIRHKQDFSFRLDLRQTPLKNNPSKDYWGGFGAVWNETTDQQYDDFSAVSVGFDGGIVYGMLYNGPEIPRSHGYTGTTPYGPDDRQGMQRFIDFIEKQTDFGEFLNFLHTKI